MKYLERKHFSYPRIEEMKDTFNQVNLLVGVKVQMIEQIRKNFKIGMNHFDRICVNLYKENDKINILIENTSFWSKRLIK